MFTEKKGNGCVVVMSLYWWQQNNILDWFFWDNKSNEVVWRNERFFLINKQNIHAFKEVRHYKSIVFLLNYFQANDEEISNS